MTRQEEKRPTPYLVAASAALFSNLLHLGFRLLKHGSPCNEVDDDMFRFNVTIVLLIFNQ